MPWPIDDNPDVDPAVYLLEPSITSPARARLQLERQIARGQGFACFADYYADRRSRGWGLDRLARETGQTRDWVRGVIRRYGSPGRESIDAAS